MRTAGADPDERLERRAARSRDGTPLSVQAADGRCIRTLAPSVALADLLGRADERDPRLVVELDPKLAAGHADGDGALAPAVRDGGGRSGDGARARRARLARRRAPTRARSARSGRRRGRAGRSSAPGSARAARSAGRAGAGRRGRRRGARPRAGSRPTPRVSSIRSPPSAIVSVSPTSTSPTPIATRPSSRTAAGYARPETAIVTCGVPARAASHAAAMRLPLPENSATEPSGFQITISARLPSAETTSTTPSEPMP